MLTLHDFLVRSLPTDLVQGVERKLRQDRSQGKMGALVATSGLLLQLATVWASGKAYLENLPQYLLNFGGFLKVPATAQWHLLGQYTLIPGLTGFLLAAPGGSGADAAQIHGEVAQFLHHDPMERLNERIKRLSLLDVQHLKTQQAIAQNSLGHLDSHIHVSVFFCFTGRRGHSGRATFGANHAQK